MDSEKMGRFIAERRRAAGLTQLELAIQLHITDKAVSRWERGLSRPDIGLLPQLAEILGVTINDLVMAEHSCETASAENVGVKEVLHYAEKSVQKKYSMIKLAATISITTLFAIAFAVCVIVDVAINQAFTWSLYPSSSLVFVWCILFPILHSGKKGMLYSLIVLTVLIVPFLFVIDLIAEANDLVWKTGTVVSVIALLLIWSVAIIMKRCNRKLIGAGISTILAAPVCVLINYSLSLILTFEAGAFDVWDVLSIVILVFAGLAMIYIDLILKKRKT